MGDTEIELDVELIISHQLDRSYPVNKVFLVARTCIEYLSSAYVPA